MPEKIKKEDSQASKQEKASDSISKNIFVIIILVINVMMLGVISYMQYLSLKKADNSISISGILESQKNEVEKVEVEDKLFPLDPFTANLAQSDGPRRYIRMEVVLKFTKDSSENELKIRMPQMRDSIIAILNSKRPDDILRKEGKAFLKEEIKASINSFLVDGKIDDVYYVSFQIN